MTKRKSVAAVLVEGSQRIEVEYGTPLWEASVEWARFHGLDPMRIPAGSVVERDAARCEIRYIYMAQDEHGELIIVDNDWVLVDMVERGEAPPMPFPSRQL